MSENATNKSTGSEHVGKLGEFIAANGETYQCRVRGTDVPPWDNDCLVIDYIRDGDKIEGAMIPVSDFNPFQTTPKSPQPMSEESKQTPIGWRSVAIWPKPAVNLMSADNSSTDKHHSEEAAHAVCRFLRREGFGGDRKIFPLETRVEPVFEQPNTPPTSDTLNATFPK